MKNTRMWAFWRRVQYGTGYLTFIGLIFSGVYFIYFYTPANCFDLNQNGVEIGVDCGGKCTRICAFTVAPPKVLWSKSFEIQKGQYNAVAYIENKNILAGTPSISYIFRLYDGAGLITERSGTTVLPPNSTYPVFEGRINTDGRVPTETTLEIKPADMWLPSTYGREQFKTVDLKLVEADARPKLNVKIENTDINEAQAVEVVATIFDASGIPLTSSQTFIDTFAGRSQKDIVFTWPNPIAKTVRSCTVPSDIVIVLDRSGSMAADSGTPPEPLESAKKSAQTFVSQLRPTDKVAFLSYATEPSNPMEQILSGNIKEVTAAIGKTSMGKTGTQYTNMGDAFTAASTELQTTRHRDDARKVIIFLTDGDVTRPLNAAGQRDVAFAAEYAKKAADVAKTKNVIIYTIGFGDMFIGDKNEIDRDADLIRSLASDSQKYFKAPTIADLESVYKQIATDICEDGAARIDVIPKVTKAFATLQ